MNYQYCFIFLICIVNLKFVTLQNADFPFHQSSSPIGLQESYNDSAKIKDLDTGTVSTNAKKSPVKKRPGAPAYQIPLKIDAAKDSISTKSNLDESPKTELHMGQKIKTSTSVTPTPTLIDVGIATPVLGPSKEEYSTASPQQTNVDSLKRKNFSDTEKVPYEGETFSSTESYTNDTSSESNVTLNKDEQISPSGIDEASMSSENENSSEEIQTVDDDQKNNSSETSSVSDKETSFNVSVSDQSKDVLENRSDDQSSLNDTYVSIARKHSTSFQQITTRLTSPLTTTSPMSRDNLTSTNATALVPSPVPANDENSSAGKPTTASIEEPETKGSSSAAIIVAILIVLVICFLVGFIGYKRLHAYWYRRHYSRVDFLIDGLYEM